MKLTLSPIGGALPSSAAEQREASAHIARLHAALDEKRAVVKEGWGPEKVHRKGKLTTWERIERLVDPGSQTLTLGTLVNWAAASRALKKRPLARAWSPASASSAAAGA
jgi:acetyl-CoA carboxylase carboxyltransferase component